ncbi:hypothetical protein A2634_01035 [Candidatus Amesbacteria bacterium RIFCSPHIGHO2_01_FULL_48_32]|uniref:methionyl-tRNA formyltransferase n=1 Tax=Candidatus Amesbacteria bacterium RIFCSPLOWO2_01_FULL_48_25 TaxID=1797259 RepID=A0A1F4ZDX1_9BACT|nr:MAG: hypothetical protein A2634_01035 [Candidatus Amesbacteria bacterium RIFCSPHIGHO2_01_FULL_48_32]OGD03624.1 MAG: hypothetical protein A2989_03015 [Candidatus Amesbacteria bacterium RIFCSPLOWO2_01_FULL_48_25]HJZ06029.1 methionyl-tRNA formyltransferase [Patescibacteria group bacterium]
MSSLVFFGSSPFSVIVLEKVLGSGFQVAATVTTPDKPAGRGLKLTHNPVKLLALKHHIPVYISPSSIPPLNLRGGKGGVIGLVAAYGKIIPQSILDKFNDHIYNIHPSLLPKYRGPSPLQQQILDGVTQTGVTIIQLDALMDHGPIVAQQKDVILPNDTWITLGNRLFEKGAKLFLTSPLPPLLNQERGTEGVRYKPQNEAEASFTQKITRQSGFIEFEKLKNYLDLGICELDIARMHRAFVGWPGIWSIDPSGKRVKLVSLSPVLVQYAGKEPQPWRDS